MNLAPLNENCRVVGSGRDGFAVEVEFNGAFDAGHVFVVVLVPVLGDFESYAVGLARAGRERVVAVDVVGWFGVIAVEGQVCSLISSQLSTIHGRRRERGSSFIPCRSQDDQFA